MSDDKFDILIVGSLANFDVILAERISELGFSCLVVRMNGLAADVDALPIELTSFDPSRIVPFRGHTWFYRTCLNARCILTVTGTLPWMLKYYWLLALILPFRPIINYCTGSDITELAREKSLAGMIYRSLVRKSSINVLAPSPQILNSALSLKINNSMFIRSPYMLAENRAAITLSGPIQYLHASNIDWGKTDSGKNRNSTKGNDRFFRAFLRALQAGCNVKCIVLDRGPDRLEARKLIEHSGFSGSFAWLPPQSPGGLSDLIAEADVVVDQFDVGCIGGIAAEAMSHDKPLISYVDETATSIFYDVPPPVVNCRTEDDIFQAIMSNQDRESLTKQGADAGRWIRSNHGQNSDLRELAFRICMLSGLEWPRRRLS